MIERPSLNKTVVPDQEPLTSSEPMPAVSSSVPAVHPFAHAHSPSLEQWSREQQMSRRHLLTLIKTGSGVAATAALLAACSLGGSSTTTDGSTATATQEVQVPTAAQAAQGTTQGGKVLAHAADVPVNSAQTFPIANQKNPGVLIHLSDQNFVAFDSTCTHDRCEVSYDPGSKLLECPCHGAAFDPAKKAAVMQGPAQVPLTPIKITVNGDGVITLA